MFEDTTDRDKDRLREVLALDRLDAVRMQWNKLSEGEYLTEASTLGWPPGQVRAVVTPCCGRTIAVGWVFEAHDETARRRCGCGALLIVLND